MAGAQATEIFTPPPRTGDLQGRFTPAARERIEAYLAGFRSFEPCLVLLYGNDNGAAAGSWSLQAISRDMRDDMARMYTGFGSIVCYDLDGLRVTVPQLAHIAELNRGVLSFRGNRLVATMAEPSAA